MTMGTVYYAPELEDGQTNEISNEVYCPKVKRVVVHKDYQAPTPRAESTASYAALDSRVPRETRSSTETLPHGFSSSGRIRSHGGGYHVMVKSPNGHSRESHFPQRFTDEKTGKTYLHTIYTKLDGSRLYTESGVAR